MLYLSPQTARLLTEERLREARQYLRQDVRPSAARSSSLAGLLGRLLVKRSNRSTCSGTC